MVEIAAPADTGSQPVGPVQRVLDKHADAALLHRVTANRRQELALNGIVQVEPDIVIAALRAEFGFDRQAREPAPESVRRVDPAEDAVVMLMKLIAIHGIAEDIGEIVPQIERILDGVEICLGAASVIGLRPAPR